jgi:TonB family protein
MKPASLLLLAIVLACSDRDAQPTKRALPKVVRRVVPPSSIPPPAQSPYQHPLYRFPPKHHLGDRPSRNPATRPVPRNTPPPVYPPIALSLRITGSVVLDVVVDRDGSVSGYQVLKPLPFGLNDAAINAVTGWKYKPGRNVDGKPVVSVITVTVPFKPPSK